MKARAYAAVLMLSGLVFLVNNSAVAEDVHLQAAGPKGIGYVGMYYGLIDPAGGSWYEAEVEYLPGFPEILTTCLAVVDTGASACILGKYAQDAYAKKIAIPPQDGVVFTDVGFGGTADFDVTQPVRMMLADQKAAYADPEDKGPYTAYGPIGGSVPPMITMAAAQNYIGGGMENIFGVRVDLDIIGTSILQGRVLQVDPHEFAFLRWAWLTMAGALVQRPPPASSNVLYVPLTMQNFFAQTPNADVGDNPMLPMKIRRTATDAFAERSALFDTGAPDNFVSETFAVDAGIKLSDIPFDTITIKGVGGDEIMCPGYYVDALALELGADREGDHLVITDTAVFVIPDDEMPVTLDGSIRLDAILGNGVFSDYIESVGQPPVVVVKETDVVEWYVDMRNGSENLIIVVPEPASVTILLLGAITVFRRRRK